MLLNNFVGVVLQHTDQPYSLSSRVVHSVLTLISMVCMAMYMYNVSFFNRLFGKFQFVVFLVLLSRKFQLLQLAMYYIQLVMDGELKQ